MPWIFGSFIKTLCALSSCHVVIFKRDSTIKAVGYNSCVTGRRPRDGNHAVSFGQSAENRSRARDRQSIRGVSDELARGCKRLHPLVPGRRYGKKKFSLLVYVAPPTTQKH